MKNGQAYTDARSLKLGRDAEAENATPQRIQSFIGRADS